MDMREHELEMDRRSLEYKKRRAAWVNTFSTPDGRKVLKEIIEECHVFETLPPGDVGMATLRNYGLSVMVLTGILDETDGNDPVERMIGMVH